jgi:hypothetical protein
VSLSHPGVAGVSVVPELPMERTAEGSYRIKFGDLYAVQPRSVGFIFHVDDAGKLGDVELGKIAVHADILSPGGVEHRTTTLPVMATLDGQDHVVPEVESAFVQFAIARAREEAIRQADQGDLQAAGDILRIAAQAIAGDTTDPTLLEVREDLLAESARLCEDVYQPADRKYHVARSVMAREGRQKDADKLSRRKR